MKQNGKTEKLVDKGGFVDLCKDPGFKEVFADINHKSLLIVLLNEILPQNAQIKDIMDIDEDSLFSRFADSTIEQLSDKVEASFKEMSVGELLDYINISTVDQKVKAALTDVTLTNFFNSLTYKDAVGIVVDMEIACGYKTK